MISQYQTNVILMIKATRDFPGAIIIPPNTQTIKEPGLLFVGLLKDVVLKCWSMKSTESNGDLFHM